MKKAYLIILDGYGLAHDSKGNAITQSDTPYLDSILESYPYAQLKTHGTAVGLPEFQTGGSEVGHITIGAGREVKHLLTRINDAIGNGSFAKNPKILELLRIAKKNNRLHIMGLMSDGGIHSFQPHVYGLLRLAQEAGIQHIFIHAFLDGRDVPERTALEYLQKIEDQGIGKIASIGGRFYGMDRDQNEDRTQKAFDILVGEKKSTKKSWKESIQHFYDTTSDSDYYLPPELLDENGAITSEDIVININFRTDRMRQISEKLTESFLPKSQYGIFGPYLDGAVEPFHFGKTAVPKTLGEVVSNAGFSQLRISETEKFNHVTFFFSGQTKEVFPLEERILVPSPKCKSYAEKPEMSAREQTKKLKQSLTEKDYSLVVQNYANADLVGHSGNLESAKKAIEILDICLSEIIPFAQEKGYEVFITADHGNADKMISENGDPNASHTKNLVPFVWLNTNAQLNTVNGTLQDIAPTVLSVLQIPIPKEMTGRKLYSL